MISLRVSLAAAACGLALASCASDMAQPAGVPAGPVKRAAETAAPADTAPVPELASVQRVRAHEERFRAEIDKLNALSVEERAKLDCDAGPAEEFAPYVWKDACVAMRDSAKASATPDPLQEANARIKALEDRVTALEAKAAR